MARNPAWDRDELILALDLYFQLGNRVPDDSETEVIALSQLLNSLPIHADRSDEERFRNPNGVALKLANFRALDQPGHGMERGGRLDRVVWEEFSSEPVRLHQIAEAIRAGVMSPETRSEIENPSEGDEEEFPEGAVIFRMHRTRERNASLVAKKKALALEANGHLACEVCGFDFAGRYGTLGEGFIECHHTLALSEVAGPQKTKLSDLVLICSNCHRMVHRRRPWLDLAQIRLLLAS
jgi:5-methylcytosine-specific restriction protein A